MININSFFGKKEDKEAKQETGTSTTQDQAATTQQAATPTESTTSQLGTTGQQVGDSGSFDAATLQEPETISSSDSSTETLSSPVSEEKNEAQLQQQLEEQMYGQQNADPGSASYYGADTPEISEKNAPTQAQPGTATTPSEGNSSEFTIPIENMQTSYDPYTAQPLQPASQSTPQPQGDSSMTAAQTSYYQSGDTQATDTSYQQQASSPANLAQENQPLLDKAQQVKQHVEELQSALNTLYAEIAKEYAALQEKIEQATLLDEEINNHLNPAQQIMQNFPKFTNPQQQS